jgi:MoaA/NifB/PqqE/SkfB family radical SAM enzyme
MIKMPWTNATAPNVMLEVTDACNVSCRACYKKKGTSFKTLDEVEKDLNAGLALRPVHTVTISGGEPTLHPELFSIVKRVKSRGVHVFLLTNGVLIDDEYLERLRDSGLDSILFHVDANQQRPDLQGGPGHAVVVERLGTLVRMAAAHGLDVSISATLYEDGIQTLKEMGRFFFDTPEISFFFVSRGMDPQDMGRDFGSVGVDEVQALLESEYGIEPFAYIPSADNRRTVWTSYFVPVVYNGRGRHLFRIRSNTVDLWLMKLQKLVSGRYIHKTTQRPGLTLFRTVVNGLTTFRFLQLARFLRALSRRSTRLKHKMIAYDDGPRLSENGAVEECEYCPTAIVRDGRLLACCTADHGAADGEEVICRTTALCTTCTSSHEARVVRKNNKIEAVVCCPKGEQRHQLSSDADMYLAIREKTSTEYGNTHPPDGMRYALNYISITNACNLSCTVCAASAKTGSESAFYLSEEEVCRRADEVRKHGGRILHLFGGEPTIHPDLLTMVERISQMGFSTGIVTNGYVLGTNKGLAKELKRRGLSRICLQFDSLDEETLERLGRNYLTEKKNAIQNTLEAGLGLGLNCTVTEHNAGELGELLAHGIELGPGVKNMTFASAAPVGRYELSSEDSPDREQIVKQLIAGRRYGLSFDDVLPLPAYLPWGIQVHPDCGAHIVLARSPDGVRPLNSLVDLRKVYSRLARNRMRRHWVSKYLVPAVYLLSSIRRGKLFRALRTFTGILMKRPGYSITNIGISNYKGAMFLDEQRIARCASAFYTSAGPVKACVHFFGNQSLAGSREYEEFNGSCPRAAV